MNLIDFSQPNGFPLEADATLGFMQSDWQGAIKGLTRSLGDNLLIVSGMAESGNNVAEGWILLDGDLVWFEAGVKQSNFIVEEVWVQKANQNGSLVNRYKTKKAKFGSGASAIPYANLVRWEGVLNLRERLLDLVGLEAEIVLKGCAVSSVNTGASTLAIASGVAMINRKFLTVSAYSGAYPVYLKDDASWTTTAPASNFIKFDPYTSQRLADVYKRTVTPAGEVIMRALTWDRFDTTGLGKWEMKGWALANGANGTVDLRSRFPVAYDERLSDPGGNIWDGGYNTVGASGGGKQTTLTVGQMPKHTHTGAANDTGNVPAESYGLVRRTAIGEVKTASGVDSTGSGNEPDVTGTPQHIPSAGNNEPFENRPPYKVVVFAQRI